MSFLETERLCLRQFTADDASFILELLNDPAFLQFIGDKGVRTLADAVTYLEQGPLASYATHGFGLYLVTLKQGGMPIGMSGLIKRPALDDVDLGYAFLPQFTGKGYASEAAQAVLTHGHIAFGLQRIVAITDPENAASIRVLEKAGMHFERMMQLTEESPAVTFFVWQVPTP